MYKGEITDIRGIEVGHAEDVDGGTGCTVVLCKRGAIAGVDVRGSAPGTRETDLMKTGRLVDKVHAIILSGGSAFGLAAADGVMQYLEEREIGFDAGIAKVPIVGAAVLFDLAYKNPKARPNAQMGYRACENAVSANVVQGSIGAGTGATVGKVLGMASNMKGGIGTASIRLPNNLIVGAIVAVNAFGDVFNPYTNDLIAGAKDPVSGKFLDTSSCLLSGMLPESGFAGNTTIGVVATNARLSKEEANKMASISHDGLALAIRPVHTMVDGDTMFALSTGEVEGDMMTICCATVQATVQAIINAVRPNQ